MFRQRPRSALPVRLAAMHTVCDRLLFIRRWITDGTHQTCQDQHSSATVREQYKCQARMKGIGARNRLQWRGNTPLRQGKGVSELKTVYIDDARHANRRRRVLHNLFRRTQAIGRQIRRPVGRCLRREPERKSNKLLVASTMAAG